MSQPTSKPSTLPPMTHNKQVVAQFTQQAVPFTQLAGHKDALDLLVKIAGTSKNSKVLDVAAGPGLVATAFAKVAKHVECLDLTPAMLAQAEQQALANERLNMSFREGDAMHLPYDDNHFDIVITRYSFHHFLAPDRALAEMIRVCKPGGSVVVADVTIEPLHSERYNYIERLRDSSHVRALSTEEMNTLFSQPAFKSSTASGYTVTVELEKQLSVSFPKDGDDVKIRNLITEDIERNTTGLSPRKMNGEVVFSYPISVYAGVKRVD